MGEELPRVRLRRLPPLPPGSKGWVYIAIAKEPPRMMTLEDYLLEERWRNIRIVDEGGWIER